jgi:phage baseplate assembly protein W
MSTEFLGVGWGFPVHQAAEGEVAMARHEDSVSQSIWLILKTRPGERAMRPDFGCGLDDSVFATVSAHTAGSVTSEVTRALTVWEPRIELLGVEVAPDERAPSTLLIEIAYRTLATNNVFNLVYPFYLEQANA